MKKLTTALLTAFAVSAFAAVLNQDHGIYTPNAQQINGIFAYKLGMYINSKGFAVRETLRHDQVKFCIINHYQSFLPGGRVSRSFCEGI